MILLPDHPHHAGGVENTALRLSKRSEPVPRGVKDALEVDVDDRIPLAFAGFVERLGRISDPGVVVDRVEPTEMVEDARHGSLDLVAFGNIAGETEMSRA
jgi:hypothetical protein